MIECISDKYMDEAICHWIAARIPECTQLKGARAIGVVRDGAPVAACAYHSYTGHNIVCDIAVAPGFSMTRKVLRALFAYPFTTLPCHRITVYVAQTNMASLNFVSRLGFVLEGRMREAGPSRDDYMILGMLKTECRWL